MLFGSALSFIMEDVFSRKIIFFKDATLRTWEDSGLDPRLIENCRKSGYRKPRSIQAALIPHVLHGDNAIGVTETGSGKTASFVLPILNQVSLFLLRVLCSDQGCAEIYE